MLWEGKPLRELNETDIRKLVESGLREHLQLEYKSDRYEDNDRGRREFLLDICMFANSSGGILLIGIPERRDEKQQPTGEPDPAGVLGIEVENPEALLLAYDARVTEAIEERLPLESHAIEVGNGRRVLAIRVPNSNNKPHSVRYDKHIYFPARRERHRYHLSVREIKEMVMRTASRLQQAEETLRDSLLKVEPRHETPYLIMGMIPLFFDEFLVDVRAKNVQDAIAYFNRVGYPERSNLSYTFEGLERERGLWDHIARYGRNGLLCVSMQLSRKTDLKADEPHVIFPMSIDLLLRTFVLRAKAVFEAAAISAPYILAMMLRSNRPLVGVYDTGWGDEHVGPVPSRDYPFPFTQIYDLSSIDQVMRPLCDQAHQMFGQAGSRNFNAEGGWIGRTDLG